MRYRPCLIFKERFLRRLAMGQFIALSAIGAVAMFALCAPQPAGAFVGNQNGIATAAAQATTNIIEVKRSVHKGTPPGWHHGKKKGWHGASSPPGQR
jgi:hypothetical protein